MMKDWRKALDDRKYVGAVLMDLSKEFDCIPHNLLLAKRQADGFSREVITVEPLFYDHPQNQIGVVVKEGWSSTRGLTIL